MLNPFKKPEKIEAEKPDTALFLIEQRVTSLEIKIGELISLLTEKNYKEQKQLSHIGKLLGRRIK